MTWYNDTSVQAAITRFLAYHPGSIVADINRHFEVTKADAPSLRHLYRVVDRMVESGALEQYGAGLYVNRSKAPVQARKPSI